MLVGTRELQPMQLEAEQAVIIAQDGVHVPTEFGVLPPGPNCIAAATRASGNGARTRELDEPARHAVESLVVIEILGLHAASNQNENGCDQGHGGRQPDLPRFRGVAHEARTPRGRSHRHRRDDESRSAG